MDQDILEVKVFSDWGDDVRTAHKVAGQVNAFLRQYPAERIVSIIPSVSEKSYQDASSSLRYTVTVVLRS